ncbi:MAG: hypothetical protein JWN37_910 [Candidatus Nomurabacteria bacterium]|nr:hypothetical protein [Candidatus Nomurabacteria bacterium]
MKKLTRSEILIGVVIIIALVGIGVYYNTHIVLPQAEGNRHAINTAFSVENNQIYLNNGYFNGEIGAPLLLRDVDAKTFISTGDYTAKDAHHTYGISAKGYLTIDGAATGPNFSGEDAPNGGFMATPASGSVPLAVTFSNLNAGANDRTLDFGDGQKYETGPKGTWPSESKTHIYSKPGTYKAVLSQSMPNTELSRVTIIVTDSKIFATIDSKTLNTTSAYPIISGTANGLSKVSLDVSSLSVECGQGDVYSNQNIPVINGKWSIKIIPPNGSIVYPCDDYTVQVSTGSGSDFTALARGVLTVKDKSQEVSVPGMSKYTDSDFGFSFWYPSSWEVTEQAVQSKTQDGLFQNGSIVKQLSIRDPAQGGVIIQEFQSSSRTITELGATRSANPIGMDIEYFFNVSTHMWMETLLQTNGGDGQVKYPNTVPANISYNTMGGLHIFWGAARWGDDVIVPLSAKNFLIITSGDTGSRSYLQLVNTIVATDPSVATPVSAEQQRQTVQAEKNAYILNQY